MASSQRVVPALPTQRWFDRGVSPVAVAVGIAAGLFGLLLVLELLLGREAFIASPYAPRQFRIALVLALLLGYVPAALAYAVRGARKHLAALRPLLRGAEGELVAASAQAGMLEAGRARRAGLIGLLGGLAIPFAVDREPGLYLRAEYWTPETGYHWALVPVVGWMIGRAGYAIWKDSRRLSALAERLGGIDLLDLAPLAPFSRQGLRIALLSLVFVSILSIIVTDRGFAPILTVGGAVTLAFAMGALVLPVHGVHRSIREEKRAELARVRSAIRGDRRALEGSRLRDWAGVASLADLVAYEGRILAVREWPFDAPTKARFGLYLLIPLGSWLGGAVVERLLGWVIG